MQRTDGGGNTLGWTYTTHADTVESYDVNGRLVSIANRVGLSQTLVYNTNGTLASVTDPFGHQLAFVYDSQFRLTQLTDPAGRHYGYSYDANNNLIAVTYPDGATRQYVYENTNYPNALTGIIDGDGVRFATWSYDYQGLAISSSLAGGVQAVNLSFNGSGSTTVTDALGAVRTHTIQNLAGTWKQTGLSVTCPTCTTALTNTTTYDINGYQASSTDFNGNTTLSTYNSRGLLTSLTKAAGKPEQQTINITWHPVFHRPTQVTYADHVDNFTYDSNGNLLQKTQTAGAQTRTWTYTYNAWGEVLTAKGPRTDLNATTTYTYDAQGRVATMTNALGQVQRITQYDANGRPLSKTDANGVVTTLQYDARERLLSRTKASHTWAYQYDGAGALIKRTDPSGVTRTYTYDAAHRLTDMVDSAGNRLHNTLDLAGNPLTTTRVDSGAHVVQTTTRVFNPLGHLIRTLDGYQQATLYTYDNNGNVLTKTDPLNHVTSFAYDGLNRKTTRTDAAGGIAHYSYDTQNRATTIKDPRGNSTTYGYNGFGNLLSQTSPDSGTQTFTYDAAGNMTRKIDARGIESDFTYDALNRRVSIVYPANTSENTTFTYDDTVTTYYRIGRLTSVQTNGIATVYAYDADGNITLRGDLSPGIWAAGQYQYDSAHRLQQITYPSGRIVIYTRNSLGQITQVQTQSSSTAALQTVVSSVAYEPFGPIKSITFANGVTTTTQHDADLRVSRITTASTPSWDFIYSYDAASNIQSIADQNTPASYSKAYTYDNLNRVVSDTNGGSTWGYQYDANNNRTLLNFLGFIPLTQTYAATSNRETALSCSAIAEDAAGNVTTTGSLAVTSGSCTSSTALTAQYNNANRMSQSTLLGTTTSYQYTGQGLRIFKQSPQTTYYNYLPDGKFLTQLQFNANGTYRQGAEYIWLDNVPIAQVQTIYGANNSVTTSQLTYIHADHLNTPRAMTDATKKIVWRWDADAYGINKPNQDPSNSGTQTVLDLRFPGQIADAETGFYYNINRYFDTVNGRYLQVDPIGLRGGLNPYAYVRGNPIRYMDLLGLDYACPGGVPAAACDACTAWQDALQRKDDALAAGDPIGEQNAINDADAAIKRYNDAFNAIADAFNSNTDEVIKSSQHDFTDEINNNNFAPTFDVNNDE